MSNRPSCRQIPTRFALAVVAMHAAAAWGAPDLAPVARGTAITAAEGAEVRDGALSAKPALVTPGLTRAHRVSLPLPDASEMAPMTAHNRRAGWRNAGDKGQPLAIGFARTLPVPSQVLALRNLTWVSTADGGRVARVEIASPGAAALRVALELSADRSGIAARFAGSAAGATGFGPVSARAIAAATAQDGAYWSPVLAGDVATLEFVAAPNVAVADVTVRIPRISHVVVAGSDLLSPHGALAKATGIGAAGACNVDVACIAPTNTAAADLAKSVAKLMFIGDSGGTFLCSGTLLNDSIQSNTPYLFGANHCLQSAVNARTLNTFWFYAAATCNSKATPPFIQLAGGAKLLGRSPDNDWSIVRLNETPPAGTRLAAWRAEPIANATSVIAVHHPLGDLAKYSSGSVTGGLLIEDDYVSGNFTRVAWNQGVTEKGSSGAALATLGLSGAYEVRGGLYGGEALCSFPNGPDYFSHLETALPVMREYLTPDAANPDGRVVAVEFYNRTLDHYFLSTNPVEIDNLDSGRTVGWERTGLRFVVFNQQAPGTNPVCRFYRAPGYGDSHFYSASPMECAQTAAAHPLDWIYESPNVFYVQIPDTGTGVCPAGTIPVYRYFNQFTTNHRYTVERKVREQMAQSSVWTAEGYGPGPYYPIMCAAAT
jgi:lysyl endopeptidase